MVSQVPHTTNWLKEYADRLVRLHQLIAEDQGDNEAADALRDEMDLPWRKMTAAEIQVAGNLSIDLYTITEPAASVVPLQPEFKSQINDALEQQRYADALQLVRENAAQLEVSAAAFLRGICWSGFGLHSAAAEFFLQAEYRHPGIAETRLCALSTLISANRESEALSLVEEWANDSDDPSLILKAAEVVFLNAVQLPDENANGLYQRTISLAERALSLLIAGTSNDGMDDEVVMARLQIAVSYARLGDNTKAREHCALARTHSPDSVVAMTVDGMLSEIAPPVSAAARLEVARRIVGPPLGNRDTPPISKRAQFLRQICALNYRNRTFASMQPFTTHTGLVCALDRSNVDTDQIIPKQFLKRIERTGYGPFLFYDWRYLNDGTTPNAQFELNRPQYQGASILLARRNFGCGSSREHAVWAIENYGFRAVIAPTFADIFYNNCFKNGVLPIRLSEEQVADLFARAAQPGYQLTIDLNTCRVTDALGLNLSFEIDPSRRHSLLNGLDDIALTLQVADKITAYEQAQGMKPVAAAS